MYCVKCGKENPDKARFCRYCGEQLRDGYIQENMKAEGMRTESTGVESMDEEYYTYPYLLEAKEVNVLSLLQ